MLSDPNRREVREEGNLLIEAVSLLVQRQRETETWIAEQIWQAEERSAASERLYAEFEARLAGIEERLAELMDDVELPREDAGVDDRLERLREQVEGLKSGPDARAPRTNPPLAATPASGASAAGAASVRATARETPGRDPEAFASAGAGRPVNARETRFGPEPRAPGARFGAASRGRTSVTRGPGVSFWDLLGPGPAERFGLVLIGAGAVAVLYAVLTQLRF
ncbi:MAG TPA: hypothetical protein VKV73_03545 [Chloroflexota bacterium]|nr:hypothetical protein [Chloroflexota bacterium]